MERFGLRYARDIQFRGDPFVLCELDAPARPQADH
jgi:hypothetical protein